MTSAPAVGFASRTESPPASRFGAFGEFMVVGGATLVLFPLAWLLRARVGLDSAELMVGFVMFHAAHVLNDPHFAVTYLLFYRDVRRRALGNAFSPAQRLRFWCAGFVVPLALGVFIVYALARHSASKLGFVFQAMFFLVGWHYVKQAFGVVTVLSARRGVRFSVTERRVVLAHCISAWLYARTNPRDLGHEASSDGVIFTTLPHPAGVDIATRLAFAASTLLLGFVLLRKWRREKRLPFAPLAGFLITVWLWTAFSKLDPLIVYVIPALHSIQYLYFVWLLRKNEARERALPPTFEPARRSLAFLALYAVGLGWLLFRGAPGLLDGILVLHDPIDLMGDTPYFAAIGSFVNIHHYFMDAVIWRRDNPETRFLIS